MIGGSNRKAETGCQQRGRVLVPAPRAFVAGVRPDPLDAAPRRLDPRTYVLTHRFRCAIAGVERRHFFGEHDHCWVAGRGMLLTDLAKQRPNSGRHGSHACSRAPGGRGRSWAALRTGLLALASHCTSANCSNRRPEVPECWPCLATTFSHCGSICVQCPHHGAKNLWMSSISGARVPRHNAARGTRKTVHVQQRRTHLTNAWWFCPTTASNCSAPLIFTEAGAGWSFSHLIWEHPMRGLWLATRHHHEGLLAAVILI